jgi:hypothetical protein
VIKRILARPGALFALVFLWKVALLILSAQPIPSNDSFFYDGPVVNLLLHGKYANPSIALALPISGTEVFCAYPPLYQLALLGWMSLFGVSAIAAMFFHLVLFGICLLLLLAIFRRLNLQVWAAHIAAAFLFVITFHDRPDSLAHVFGIAAVYSWIRSRNSLAVGRVCPQRAADDMKEANGALGQTRRTSSAHYVAWTGAMAGFVLLSLATGLQIGGVYFLLIWIGMLATTVLAKETFPIAPMLALLVVPLVFAGVLAFSFPRWWAGFLEHARQTPSLTGLRAPRLAEILKIVRTVPGVLAVGLLLPWWFSRQAHARLAGKESVWLVTLVCTLAALAIVCASMFVLTPNSIFFAGYLQPLIVAGYLAILPSLTPAPKLVRLHALGFLVLAAIGSIRAIGMSTWGLACAADVSYPAAIERVRNELKDSPRNSIVVLSSAYLYEAARHEDIRWIHSDWMAPARRGGRNTDLEALLSLKPAKLILTQFDFYRRYRPIISELKSGPGLLEVKLIDTAGTRPPDSFNSLQKIVQHISWAPVIVKLSWR